MQSPQYTVYSLLCNFKAWNSTQFWNSLVQLARGPFHTCSATRTTAEVYFPTFWETRNLPVKICILLISGNIGSRWGLGCSSHHFNSWVIRSIFPLNAHIELHWSCGIPQCINIIWNSHDPFEKKTISFGRSLDYIASVSTSCENIPPQATPMVHQHPPERPKLNESRQTMRIFPFAQWSCLFEDVLWTINRGEVGWSRYSHSTEMARATSFKFWPSILPRNSFHWRWKGISLVQPYPVHLKKKHELSGGWTTQMKNMVLSNWSMYIIYIHIYIDRLYEPNSNKNESYK